MTDWARIRKDFPILDRKIYDRRLIYLDSAATSLKPRQVIDIIQNYYLQQTANVHRGIHLLSAEGTALFEKARDRVRTFLGAGESAEIVFTRGTTEAINLVAQSYGRKNLRAGDEIIISEMDHHSNIVPWQMIAEEKECRIKVVPVDDQGDLIFEKFKTLLSDRTKIVALPFVSNTLGTVNILEPYVRAAHEVGAVIMVDGAQAVSKFHLNMKKTDYDFFAFSSHKLFGPTGIGVLYGKKKLLDEMPPYQGGGSMITSVTFEKTSYEDTPQKFEAGTPHIAGAIGLAAAIDYTESIGVSEIFAHGQDLLRYSTEKLKSIPGVRVIGEAKQKVDIISFVMGEGAHPHDIGTVVDREGVAIRTGHHCTQPLMKRFGIPATARASFSVYNTREDVDVLHRSLLKAREILQ